MIIHVVQPGETIYSIAENYGISAERLIQDNELSNPNNLVIGQTIVIVYPGQTYTVQEGDTLESIADAYQVTQIQLLRNNPTLSEGNYLYPGETIVINYKDDKIGNISTIGYTYPFIDKILLRKTLPFLTYLTIFACSITPQGEIIQADDTEVVQIAKEYGVAPLLLIAIGNNQEINKGELAHTILNNKDIQKVFLDNIHSKLQSKGYYGLILDTKFILPEDRELYVEFITNVSNQLTKEGFEVFITLTTMLFSEQTDMIYEGYDYAGLGQAADDILLLSYEWGYTLGPVMAVIPISRVREYLDYAVSQISSGKIFIGIPSIGYDWEIPYTSGISKVQTLSNNAAVELARQVGAVIEFDEASQAPFFLYTDTNREQSTNHIVWFKDARSIDTVLKLVSEYELKGIGAWNIMQFFAQMWLVINSQYEIDKVL